MEGAHLGEVVLAGDLNQLMVDPNDWPAPFASNCEPRPIIGSLALSNKSCDPEYRIALHELAQQGNVMLRCLAEESEIAGEWGLSHPRVAVFVRGEISATRFINSIHFFNALPASQYPDTFRPFIALALARGAVVFLAPDACEEFGCAAVAATPEEISSLVEQFVADEDRFAAQSQNARRYASEQCRREAYLAGFRPEPKGGQGGTIKMPPSKGRERHSQNHSTALFVSSNGIGLGHLVRLMAIARRCPKHVTPVFVTMTQAIDKVVEEGWFCEYLTSPSRIAGPYRSWDAYFRQELEGIAEFHRPNLIVYDGNSLPPGLVEFVGGRHDVGLVWVRRAMWGHWSEKRALHHISAQKTCDLVIEPQELAEERDFGATVTSVDKVPPPMNFARVPPITYLETREMLSRDDARRELGITKPRTVLVALGAGAILDQYETAERVIAALKGFEGIQIVVARHILSDDRVSLWQGVDTVELFPLGRFLRAFDAVVASAGYNTFHELVQYRVPTLFIPVEAEEMDRQLDRAHWAASKGLAGTLRQQDLDRLPQAVAELLNEKRRENRTVPKVTPNGATCAAALVGELALRYAQWPNQRRESMGRPRATVDVG